MKLIHKLDNGVTLEMLKEIDPRWTQDIFHKYLTYRSRQALTARRGRTAFKDSSRQKVYDAEYAFIRSGAGKGIEFKTLAEANRYLKKVLASKTYAKLNGKSAVYLESMRERDNARIAGRAHWDGKITLCPTFGMNEYTLLHELAHQCGHMHHDVGFRQTLVKLVSRFMGRELGTTLEKIFKKSGLKMKLNTTVRDPEQWLNSYFRMQNARTKLA